MYAPHPKNSKNVTMQNLGYVITNVEKKYVKKTGKNKFWESQKLEIYCFLLEEQLLIKQGKFVTFFNYFYGN